MNYVTSIFETITSAVTSFVETLGQAISGITNLFWTTGENAGPTFLGVLMLILAGIGLVYGAFRLIRGLIGRLQYLKALCIKLGGFPFPPRLNVNSYYLFMKTKEKKVLTKNELEKKKEKNILIVKILSAIALTISVVSMLFSCVAMSNNNNNQVQEQTNISYLERKNLNTDLGNNNEILNDYNKSFIVNNNSRVKFNLDCFTDAPTTYLNSLYGVLERYYSPDTHIQGATGLLNKYFYYNSENDNRVERSWFFDYLVYSNNGGDKYIYIHFVENPGFTPYTLTLDLQNPTESILDSGSVWYGSGSFNLMTLDFSFGMATNDDPFRLWSLYFNKFSSYYRYSPTFNFNQFLQKEDITKNDVVVRSPTPFVESLEHFAFNGQYIEYTPGLFMSGGYIYDTIRVYYASANGLYFLSNNNEYITGGANTYYLTKIVYLLDNDVSRSIEAFTRIYEMRAVDGNSQKVYLNRLNRATNVDELCFFDITGRFGVNKREVSLYILSLLNAVNNISGFTDTSDPFTSIFALIAGAFSGIASFLNIEIFGNYTLGVFLLIPLMITIILFIVKLFKRQNYEF